MLLIRLLDYLHCKPHAGFITSISGWLIGSIPINDAQILSQYQDIILWCMQIISLLVGTTAGVFTIVSLISRKKKKCK